VRLNVVEHAIPLLLKPVIPPFVDRYPDVSVDVSVSNKLVDVIGSGFDAGIRFGGTVPEDMVAQRLSADLRWIAAASPDDLRRFGTPKHPDELRQHRCVRIRLGNEQIYQWEFERKGETVVVATPGQIAIDDSQAMLAFGLGGVGIVYGLEAILRPYIEAGSMVPVLEAWASMGSGFHIYYSSRRHVPTGLRLLIEMIKDMQPLGA